MAINQLLINQVITVSDLMTPWEFIITVEKNNLEGKEIGDLEYDLTPVVENKKIVGVLEKGINKIQPFSEKWIISHDTSVPELIYLFSITKQKAFMVLAKKDIIGIVSPADLNKSQARVFIYHLIGELELELSFLVRSKFGYDSEGILAYLKKKRKKELLKNNVELKNGNSQIDIIQQLYLSDFVDIISKDKSLRDEMGFPSIRKAAKVLGGLNELRNQTMHVVKPLVKSVPEGIYELQDRLNRINDILKTIEEKQQYIIYAKT